MDVEKELKSTIRKLKTIMRKEREDLKALKDENRHLTAELHQLKQTLTPKPVVSEAPTDERLDSVRAEVRELRKENQTLATRNAKLKARHEQDVERYRARILELEES